MKTQMREKTPQVRTTDNFIVGMAPLAMRQQSKLRGEEAVKVLLNQDSFQDGSV